MPPCNAACGKLCVQLFNDLLSNLDIIRRRRTVVGAILVMRVLTYCLFDDAVGSSDHLPPSDTISGRLDLKQKKTATTQFDVTSGNMSRGTG
jgi:hypothetical protein